jgi:beta-galactosidase
MLNGKMVDEKMPDSLLTAKFELPYVPGELRAVTVEDGKETASVVLTTAGTQKSLRLKADRQQINASRNDLSYIMVEVVDEKGNVVPVQMSLCSSPLAVMENSLALVMQIQKIWQVSNSYGENTFRGKCLVVLRPKGHAGEIVLEAKAEGLQSAIIIVTTK